MGSTITTATLRKVVTVQCEQCGKTYYYIGTVTGQKESSFSFFNADKAVAVAEERARRNAERKNAWLRVVKCPYCRRLQRNMVSRLQRTGIFGIGALILGVVGVIHLSGLRIVALALGLLFFGIWAKSAFLPPAGFTEGELLEEMNKMKSQGLMKQ